MDGRLDEACGERARVGRRIVTRGADEQRLDVGKACRPVGHGADADARLDDDPASRRSTTAAIDCAKSPVRSASSSNALASPSARERPDGLDDELTGLERREEVRDEEVRGGDLAPARSALHDHSRVEDGQAERQLGGAVRMGDRAADRAAVPRDEVPDERQRLPDERMHALVDGERRLPDGRADPEGAVCRDLAQAGVVHVDEHARPDEAHRQRRDEALAAGERLRVVAAVCERGERLLDRAGADVLEGRPASSVLRVEQGPDARRRER